jgi:choline dehydrogenase-like flavoprotein
MVIVIGSGPAAIAATQALLRQGQPITILDVGNRLEVDRQKTVELMSGQDPCSWNPQDLDTIIGSRRCLKETNHSKLSYGSSYVTDPMSDAVGVRWEKSAGFNHSLARGGLSNIWGASLLPYRQEDIMDWPIPLSDLEPHYRAIMDFVPCASAKDDLEEILPTYSTRHQPLAPSRQCSGFLNDLEKRRTTLRQSGIHFGGSRLAIRASGDGSHRECAKCALCLSGCPYGLIYSSAQTLDDLIQSDRVRYLADHLVEKLEQTGNEVFVTGRNLATDLPFSHRATRVFLGAGVLPTAKIVLNSLNAFDRPVRLLDSQYFIFPLLRMKATDGVETEKMHTSAQVYLEIGDKKVSDHLVHLQIYGYSSFLHQELQRTILRWPLRFTAFRRHFLGRLLVVQGFIHSRESGSVELSLGKNAEGKAILHAKVRKSGKAFTTTLKVGWKLLKQSLNLRAVTLLPGLRYFNPGSGYHSGGSFPMRQHPRELETDTLGRLPAMDRVHLVDASVMPSVPATSITFSLMANAHRIGTLAGQLDQPHGSA